MVIYPILFFIFGLCVGSFLNAYIYRLEAKKSILKGRSFCPKCKHKLGAWDLIPVFSFIFLSGKCRYCKKPISWQYPLVEIFTGILFVLAYQYSNLFTLRVIEGATYKLINLITLIYLLSVICLLMVIFVYDLKHSIIPDKVIYPAILLAIGYLLLAIGIDFLTNNSASQLTLSVILKLSNHLLPAIGAGGFFFSLVLTSKGRWMGGGDIKLTFFMGLFLGWPKILPAMFFAFISGSLVSFMLIILKRKGLKSQIPFGPFLVAGTFVALFWGNAILSWYLRILGIYY